MLEYWLYPGAVMSVSALTKITVTPAAPGETPPPGAMVIPPQAPSAAMARTISAGLAANLAVESQGVAAAVAMTHQQSSEAQTAFEESLKRTNEAAVNLTQEQTSRSVEPPPWEITFREKR